jgi:hypothetical protein
MKLVDGTIRTVRWMLVAAGMAASSGLVAQTPAGIPAGSTGQCKDGSYTSSSSKSGACHGHQGVKDWYATAPAKGAAPAGMTPSPASAPVAARSAPSPATAPVAAKPAPSPSAAPMASRPAPSAASAAPASVAAPTPAKTAPSAITTQASGGGPGLVWVNTPTKVYHCPGSRYYGKTKEGKYMSEAEAIGMGARADHGTACSK